MNHNLFGVLRALVMALILASGSARGQDDVNMLRAQVEEILFGGEQSVAGIPLAARRLLPRIYSSRNFELAWQSDEQIQSWLHFVAGLENEGLRPDDYLLSLLQQMFATRPEGRDRVWFDFLLTESLIRAAYHLRFGKVDPAGIDPNWNMSRTLDEAVDPVQTLNAALDSGDFAAFAERILARGPLYLALKQALAKHREVAAQGGWPVVPDGNTLRRGERHPRVPLLRERLRLEVDAPDLPDASDEMLFDDTLEAAVIDFQQRHGLTPDGLVGRNTLAAINVPVTSRIDQLRVNLERGRWISGQLPEEFLVVNIAGFRVFHVRDGWPVWMSRAQVGKPYRQTPVFRSQLEYLVVNPTWTVPPTILKEDIVPRAKADPGFLKERNIAVLTRGGVVVDPLSLDWSRLSADRFPYILRQGPGPGNALGRVKFIFPNEYFVFLHDTPSRELFERSERAFSSGCIRVENPLALAELVLKAPERWTTRSLGDLVATGRTQTLFLDQPLPVLVLYFTASVELDGRLRLLNDVYDRDGRVLDALNRTFESG